MIMGLSKSCRANLEILWPSEVNETYELDSYSVNIPIPMRLMISFRVLKRSRQWMLEERRDWCRHLLFVASHRSRKPSPPNACSNGVDLLHRQTSAQVW